MFGTGNPHVEDIRSRHHRPRPAAGLHRRPVRHAVHDILLHHFLTRPVEPCPPPVAVDPIDGSRRPGQAVDPDPLLDDLGAIDGTDRPVLRTVPDRDARPVSPVGRCRPDQPRPYQRRPDPAVDHGAQRIDPAIGRLVRHSGDDGAAREDFGVSRQQGTGHGAAGGQAGHEDPRRVQPVARDQEGDHLPDRQRLAGIPLHVGRTEPAEAAVEVVGPLLLRQNEREAELFSQLRPADAMVVAGGGLAAAMKRHDQRSPCPDFRRHEAEHAQVAGVRTELRYLLDFRLP